MLNKFVTVYIKYRAMYRNFYVSFRYFFWLGRTPYISAPKDYWTFLEPVSRYSLLYNKIIHYCLTWRSTVLMSGVNQYSEILFQLNKGVSLLSNWLEYGQYGWYPGIRCQPFHQTSSGQETFQLPPSIRNFPKGFLAAKINDTIMLHIPPCL
jgi:hypothetical protein